MSDTTAYTLKIEGVEGEDLEFFLFKFFKAVPDADSYFDVDGTPSGNGYDWRNMETEMRAFTRTMPHLLIEIDEHTVYDSTVTQARHYFKGGNYARVEPVVSVTWPEFNEGMLS